jgi:hypothetical protein
MGPIILPAMNDAFNNATEPKQPALPEQLSVQKGRYQHYKGGLYQVLGVVRHSETLEPLVLYRPLYGDSGDWVRPYAMFFSDVSVAGVTQPRFAYLGPA